MNFSEEELKQVEEYAGLFLTWEDIAVLLEKEISEFQEEFKNKNSQLFRAYRRGQAIKKRDIRRPVIKMAEHGSPQAELLVDKYISDQAISELDD